MNDTGDVTQNRQTDVDEQIDCAAALEEHSKRRQDDREDDLADISEKAKVHLLV